MNIERNKELSEMIAAMADVAKKFKSWGKDINDEDIYDMCHKIESCMNESIVELSALQNYIYTQDVVNWTEGNNYSTLELAKR